MTKNPHKNQLLTQLRNTFYFSIILLGAIIILIAPLVHIGFSTKNQYVENYKKQINKPLLKLNQKIKEARASYNNNEITAVNFIALNDELNQERKKLISNNSTKINKVVDENRVFGWKTNRSFLIGFGIRLPYLVFSIIISMLIARTKYKSKLLNVALSLLQVMCFSISFYVVIWCFWSSQDYPLETYWLAMMCFTTLSAVFTTIAFRYYVSNVDKINRIRETFVNFIVEFRNVHYKKLLSNAISKDLHNDTYQNELRKNTRELENRMYDKVDEILE